LTRETKSFIPFVTAGHPDLETTREIILSLAALGSAVIEIGIPFSDPIADGPIIQRSSFAALQHGYKVSDYIQMVKEVRSKSDVGLIFMTYLNPAFRYGLAKLDEEAAAAGLDGILISDLTPEESLLLVEREGQEKLFQNLDTIFLVAPTSSQERIERICQASSGFVYLIARTGVTGKQTEIDRTVSQSVQSIRVHTALPIAVGFGITSKANVETIWQYADAAVVGSAIVRFIEEHKREPDLPRVLTRYVKDELMPDSLR
jgi:tryptophan synthase alpha chain